MAALAMAMCVPARAADPVVAIEFYNAGLDHYFVSPLLPDIEALDSGRFGGWARTGQTFPVFPTATPAAGAGVCRFYIPPEHGDSHFFSASATECAQVLANVATDPNFSGYVLESPDAFYVALPNTSTGACPAGMRPLYRLWNQRADSNHRYTTSAATKAAMQAQGYEAEGYGPDAVAMCVPERIDPVLSGTVRVSGDTTFGPDCALGDPGILYPNAEVEPFLAVNPANPANLIGVWQQDRFSNGGARGLLTGFSLDGGRTWTRRYAAFTRCTGGTVANGANYARASDPWVTFSPDGTAHQIAIAFNGQTLQAGSSSAVLVSRSSDGGNRWSPPIALVADGEAFFSDKESITADPSDPRFVYAVWDRLTQDNRAPTWFARTVDGGASWEPARQLHDPGTGRQTLNNQVVVLPDGTVLLFFSRLDNRANPASPDIAVMRSIDRGATWSGPVPVTTIQSVGTKDPETGAKIRDGSTLFAVTAGRSGQLALAWQDARFGGADHDGIAFSRSSDGGLTWSPAVGVNAVPSAPAFVPSVAIRDDGVIGIAYYDLRSNTADPSTLPADYWLAQSADGVNWSERRVAGAFDFAQAPIANGLFVGDYQGLATIGTTFVPMYATARPDPGNRTDVFVSFLSGAATADKRETSGSVARSPVELPDTPAMRARLREAVAEVLARRVVGAPAVPAPRSD